MTLDARRVPEWFVPLLPRAERWNIGDDGDRESAIEALDDQELSALAHSLDGIEQQFWEWLDGREDAPPEEDTPEYVAMVVFGMAVDLAGVIAEQRSG